VNDYGVEKPDGRFHQGIDMFAPRGTSVYAPVSGTLEAINGDRGGLQFWLTGDDGNLYIGTHLQGFGLVGHVKQGDVIGSVGDTGDAIGGPTHLHFELLVKGEATNPYNTLRNACG
jgi:murein DD-endopeptidase MepM/ murein hydrolase activator NlpD